jgi:hypothetical protein
MLMGCLKSNRAPQVWKGNLSRKNVPHTGRPPSTLGPQLRTFLEKVPFASAGVIDQHLHTAIPAIKDTLQRELGMKDFSRRWVSRFLSSARKATRVKAPKEMVQTPQGSEANQMEGIAKGDEFWFRHSYSSSKMFAQFPAEVIPRTRQAIGAKKSMIALFSTARKLIAPDVLRKGRKYNSQYLGD